MRRADPLTHAGFEEVAQAVATARAGSARLRVALVADALAVLAVSRSAQERAEAFAWVSDPQHHDWPLSCVAICEALGITHETVVEFAVLIQSADPTHRHAIADALRECVPHRIATPVQVPPRPVPHTCPVCGAPYSTRYLQKRTCSPACAATFECISKAEKHGRACTATDAKAR